MRLRHGPAGVPREAAPDPQLTLDERLQAARLYVITPERDPDQLIDYVGAVMSDGLDANVVLLGMSFLKRVEFTQRGDQLILRQ